MTVMAYGVALHSFQMIENQLFSRMNTFLFAFPISDQFKIISNEIKRSGSNSGLKLILCISNLIKETSETSEVIYLYLL